MSSSGLTIPGILLSDENPRETVTKTPSGAELPRVFWSQISPRVFVRQQYTRND